MFKILIVEDDKGIRQSLCEHISKWGYDVNGIQDEKLDDTNRSHEIHEKKSH